MWEGERALQQMKLERGTAQFWGDGGWGVVGSWGRTDAELMHWARRLRMSGDGWMDLVFCA